MLMRSQLLLGLLVLGTFFSLTEAIGNGYYVQIKIKGGRQGVSLLDLYQNTHKNLDYILDWTFYKHSGCSTPYHKRSRLRKNFLLFPNHATIMFNQLADAYDFYNCFYSNGHDFPINALRISHSGGLYIDGLVIETPTTASPKAVDDLGACMGTVVPVHFDTHITRRRKFTDEKWGNAGQRYSFVQHLVRTIDNFCNITCGVQISDVSDFCVVSKTNFEMNVYADKLQDVLDCINNQIVKVDHTRIFNAYQINTFSCGVVG
eukprot:m.136414 g.136414  ORF g.136414 m.136414 type:complete len:261 (+) comp10657_c0_seq1:91-873(+)